jgi:hypothetical protein
MVLHKTYYYCFIETSCVTRTHGGISNATNHKLWCYDTPSRTCHRVYGIRNGNTEICENFRLIAQGSRRTVRCAYPGRFLGLRASHQKVGHRRIIKRNQQLHASLNCGNTVTRSSRFSYLKILRTTCHEWQNEPSLRRTYQTSTSNSWHREPA